MFNKLKEALYRYRFRRWHKPTAAYPDWAKVKTVLLFFDSDSAQQNLPIRQLVKELRAEGKRVTAWGYINQKEIVPTTLPDFFVFGKGQVDFWEKPQQFEVLNHFIDKHYDILLDITTVCRCAISQCSHLPILGQADRPIANLTATT